MTESLGAHRDRPLAIGSGNRRVLIALYGVAATLYWGSLYLYMPILPTYVQSKVDSLALVGVVLAQYGLWQGIVRLPIGIAADWLGRRKPFIVAGFVLAALGPLLLGTASEVGGLAVGRAVTGLAAGAWVPLLVAFSGLFPPEEAVRASAALVFVQSIGRLLVTGITGSLTQLGGYLLPFLLAAGMGVLAVLAMLPVREDRHPVRRPSVGAIGRLISRRDVLLPALLAAVSHHAVWAATFAFVPILAKEMGATDVTQSIMQSVNVAVGMLGNVVTTAAAVRLGSRRLVYCSFALLFMGLGGVALAPSLPLLLVSQWCIGFSMGIGHPVLMGMSIRHVVDANRTTAMGLHQAVYAFGMFSGPWLGGILAAAFGIRAMLGATAVAAIVLGLFTTGRLMGEGPKEAGAET
jgi:MFS family permease